MAVIKAVSSKAGIGHAIDYVTKKEKTEEKLVSGLHCEPETVKEEMQATKELWGKTDGRTYKHYVQSYHEDEEITPEQAHKNAVELAEHTKAWKGHEVLIATHIDKGHIHTHFIVNSVNYENGHKLQWKKYDIMNRGHDGFTIHELQAGSVGGGRFTASKFRIEEIESLTSTDWESNINMTVDVNEEGVITTNPEIIEENVKNKISSLLLTKEINQQIVNRFACN